MKSLIRKVLKESEHLKGLLSELPPFLKRRITMFDLEWLDKELPSYINQTPWDNNFDQFSSWVLGDLLHDFVLNRKDNEIDTIEDPAYGIVYSDDSLDEVFGIYFELAQYIKKRYEIRLRQAWERKKSR